MKPYKWSCFCLFIRTLDGILIKSGLTGAVVVLNNETKQEIDRLLAEGQVQNSLYFEKLSDPDMAIIVSASLDEYSAWEEKLVTRRNNEAHVFTLHFLPTLQCQLCCSYCLEKGIEKGIGMSQLVLSRTKGWVTEYLDLFPKIDLFKLVLFGGEPLLQKRSIKQGVEIFHSIASERQMIFKMELVTNGEYLDIETARTLSLHEWSRVQITLDGPADVHDSRRHRKDGRPTFEKIMNNIQMLLSTDYIQKVDVRISLDIENADRIPELIRYLADFGAQNRINLSLGLTTPTFAQSSVKGSGEVAIAEKALAIWKIAKECGFVIPEEFVVGPWCVAIAKHSLVLQPNGFIQKCFCTVGRKEYNFGSIYEKPNDYLRDPRFEHFCRRTEECVREKCKLLPFCGGGCIHDAIIAHGSEEGSQYRHCQKDLIDRMNHGLLALNYV